MNTEIIKGNVAAALKEDLGEEYSGGSDICSIDLTANLLPAGVIISADLICRENAILCGKQWFEEVFKQLDKNIAIIWEFSDGDPITKNCKVCRITGPAREVLTGERTALNFLQTLSGTATNTRAYVDAIAGTDAVILDTRKTLPGLRDAQKYAVRCGGGLNHRMGLYDAILIKENHIYASGSVQLALEQAKAIHTGKRGSKCQFIEIEVESLDQLAQAIKAGATRIMLDNFSVEDIKIAVKTTSDAIELEASGGINLDNIRSIATTGIDYISVGDITKNLHATDFSLLISPGVSVDVSTED
ncbi:MAG: carboxylating nicotinate-nucleotide diphosphorylase [Acidiferrobacterales bacterium]